MPSKEIINLIKSYINEDEYKKSINTEKKLIAELKSVDKTYLLDCILANKLVQPFIKKYGQDMKIKNKNMGAVSEEHQYDLSRLAGIFIILLQEYTYEDIVNAKNITGNFYLYEFDDVYVKNILEYITYLYRQI